MTKIDFRYNKELVAFAREIGGRWNKEEKVWEIPDDKVSAIKTKAEALGVTLNFPRTAARADVAGSGIEESEGEGAAAPYGGRQDYPRKNGYYNPAAKDARQRMQEGHNNNGGENRPQQGSIWLRKSNDGRFLLMRIDLVAFAEDVQAVLDGSKKGARFRIMVPRPQEKA